jgi:periplasmic divalent cation tolerance protein
MPEEALVVLATFPDADTARRIVRTLVEERLAACGNLIPAVESIYRWEGKVESATEILAVLKTDLGHYRTLEARLAALHPYQVPECIALRVEEGLPGYLRWITGSVNEP